VFLHLPLDLLKEETWVIFYDKQMLAHICGSDKAVAGHVNLSATFPSISCDTGKR